MLLKRFKVKNYKCFKKEFSFDLSKTRDYSNVDFFISNQVDEKTRISKKALLYGYNGIGKSSLCLAIMDITNHLTDNEKLFDGFFFNLENFKNNSKNNYAVFEYVFDDNGKELIYKYTKSDILDLVREELIYDDNVVFKYSYGDIKDENVVNIEGLEHLATIDLSTKTSFLRYINTVCNYTEQGIGDLSIFASKMLYFRSTNDGNRYVGYKKGSHFIFDEIASNNMISDFENFLKSMGIDYKLEQRLNTNTNRPTVVANFNGNVIALDTIASSGTKVLSLFYYWMKHFDDLSFLIIDEFDAYYHSELAELVYKMICSKNMQSIVTTHNTDILSYDCCRPDCVYVSNGRKVENLSNLANEFGMKEIRKGNNLKNLYKKFIKNMK